MPRFAEIQTNFTAGEISPRLKGRVDVARYANAVALMENYRPLVHGGAKRRDGLRHVLEVRDSTKKCRVVGFVFSRDQAYILELGHQTLRFYRNHAPVLEATQAISGITQANPGVLTYVGADPANGDWMLLAGIGGMTELNGRYVKVANVNAGANTFELTDLSGTNINTTGFTAYTAGGTIARVYTLATPWTENDIFSLTRTQLYDALFFAHNDFYPRQLTRYGHADWKLANTPFQVEPIAEQGDYPATTLTPAATSGAGVNFTAGAASFLDSDVGRYLQAGAGRALITGFTSTTVVVCTIIDNFPSTAAIASQAWRITDTMHTTCTPTGTLTLGGAATLTLAVNGWRNDAQVNHVGAFVAINDGLVEITAFTSALIVTGIVRTALSVSTAASEGAWTLERKVWSATNGYPCATTIFEQRLLYAGSIAYPSTVWGSKSAQIYNFAIGANDEDGLDVTIASNEISQVQHLASTTDLLVMSYGGEYRMFGGNDLPLTPTSVRVKNQAAYGSNRVPPVRVGNGTLFATRSGKKLRLLNDRLTNDGSSGMSAPDVTVFAEHITGGGLVDLTYQQEPDSTAWAPRTDGQFLALALDTDQEVVGFGRQITAGSVESSAAIPFGALDEVWHVVKRTDGNGVAKRYIEYGDPELETDSAITGAVADNALVTASWAAGLVTVEHTGHGWATGDYVKLEDFVPTAYNITRTITVTDADHYTMALTTDPGAVTTVGVARRATATWGGLWHLDGVSVEVVADESVLGNETPSGGNVTIDRPAFDVQFGRHYSPKITMLPIEQRALGTAQSRAISVHEITIKFHESGAGHTVDGNEIPGFQHGVGVLDQPPALVSADKVISKTLWEKSTGGEITIEQTKPRPSQILAIVRKVAIND